MVGVLGDGPLKKLEAAALYYLKGGGEHDEARKDALVFGGTEESIEAEYGAADPNCYIWPENWVAWQAFLAVCTQWSVSMNGPTALDYTRVRDGLSMAGIEVTPEIFNKMRVIESTILSALSKKGKAEK